MFAPREFDVSALSCGGDAQREVWLEEEAVGLASALAEADDLAEIVDASGAAEDQVGGSGQLGVEIGTIKSGDGRVEIPTGRIAERIVVVPGMLIEADDLPPFIDREVLCKAITGGAAPGFKGGTSAVKQDIVAVLLPGADVTPSDAQAAVVRGVQDTWTRGRCASLDPALNANEFNPGIGRRAVITGAFKSGTISTDEAIVIDGIGDDGEPAEDAIVPKETLSATRPNHMAEIVQTDGHAIFLGEAGDELSLGVGPDDGVGASRGCRDPARGDTVIIHIEHCAFEISGRMEFGKSALLIDKGALLSFAEQMASDLAAIIDGRWVNVRAQFANGEGSAGDGRDRADFVAQENIRRTGRIADDHAVKVSARRHVAEGEGEGELGNAPAGDGVAVLRLSEQIAGEGTASVCMGLDGDRQGGIEGKDRAVRRGDSHHRGAKE